MRVSKKKRIKELEDRVKLLELQMEQLNQDKLKELKGKIANAMGHAGLMAQRTYLDEFASNDFHPC